MKEQHRLYTAGQLAKMYSLKKDTILYYDRIGLFCPEGRAENGYRQYSHSQLTELDAILGMRELGMPIASIRQAITGTDIPSFTALLESERRAVEAKIASLKERSQVLTSMIATIDKACGSPKEVLFFEKRPSCHIVTADIVYEDGMGCEDAWQKAYDHILDKAEQALMPVVGSIIEPQKAVEGRYAKVYATYTGTGGRHEPSVPPLPRRPGRQGRQDDRPLLRGAVRLDDSHAQERGICHTGLHPHRPLNIDRPLPAGYHKRHEQVSIHRYREEMAEILGRE